MKIVAIYNNAISFCVDVFENEWKEVEKLDTMQRNSMQKTPML